MKFLNKQWVAKMSKTAAKRRSQVCGNGKRTLKRVVIKVKISREMEPVRKEF